MLKIISWFIIGIIYNIGYCYIFSKIIKQEFKLNKKLLFTCMFFALVNCYTIYFTAAMRPIITNFCMIILFFINYKKNILITAMIELYIFLMFVISEAIFVLIFIGILKLNGEFLQEHWLGLLITNGLIFIITNILAKFFFIKLFKLEVEKWSYNKNLNNIVLYVLGMATVMMLVYPLFNYKITLIQILFSTIILAFSIIFVIGFFRQKNDNLKLLKEYDSLIRYSETYEKLIDEKSKQQHENKNQLIIVKSMIEDSKKNKSAIEYIDKLLNIEEENKDYNYLNKLKNIPTGIKGLIYYKIEQMKKLKIEVYLDVPKKLTKKNLKSCENNIKDLSRILGVYLDNAKEAASESVNKYIIIELTETDNCIEFNISNTYKGDINLDKIDKEGFTTKGKGHGYGLSLVNDIIKKNNIFFQSRNINGMYYVQKLKIKK